MIGTSPNRRNFEHICAFASGKCKLRAVSMILPIFSRLKVLKYLTKFLKESFSWKFKLTFNWLSLSEMMGSSSKLLMNLTRAAKEYPQFFTNASQVSWLISALLFLKKWLLGPLQVEQRAPCLALACLSQHFG